MREDLCYSECGFLLLFKSELEAVCVVIDLLAIFGFEAAEVVLLDGDGHEEGEALDFV